MSIIYEALKKMQDSHKETPGVIMNSPLKAASRKFWLKKQLGLSFIGIALGILLVWLIMNKLTAQHKVYTSAPAIRQKAGIQHQKTASPAPAASAKIATDEKTPNQEMPELILNGIVLSEDGNLALINDQMARVGDEIDGIRIEEITNKQVILTFKDQKIVLENK